MAQGDTISVVYKTGVGTATSTIVATKEGRKVEHETVKEDGAQWIVVRELTRGGTLVREARFTKSEVVALVTGHDED